MIITDFIINDIEPLLMDDNIGKAQDVFTQTTYSHIPVMNNGIYLGCIAENDVHCLSADELIKDHAHMLEGFYVREETVWLNILEAFGQNNTNIIPVLDESNIYRGYYELTDIVNYFNSTPFLSEIGNILIVEKGIWDYSFSEISQIVESSEGQVLGAFISKIENDVAQISIKIGRAGSINDILQTFRRYGYNIVSNHQEDALLNDLRERSQYLEKYLNI